MSICVQCPRACGVERNHSCTGFCGVPDTFRVARASLHFWEEPFISGKRGSGTVFFSGCNLQCVFCQNREISGGKLGKDIDAGALEELFFRLRDAGAHNINLVTPSHYAMQLRSVLERIKDRLIIPIVYNCGGYERLETLRSLEGLIDIYLPDLKYYSSALSEKYSGAADYFAVASQAIGEMIRQTGKPSFDADGMMKKGVVVRHLVLPGARQDSIQVLSALHELFGSDSFLLSLMNQYTPDFAKQCPYPELHRRLTTFEYQSVLNKAEQLGFEGCIQGRDAANASYTPDFYEQSFL